MKITGWWMKYGVPKEAKEGKCATKAAMGTGEGDPLPPVLE
jgi:hypothetical protein